MAGRLWQQPYVNVFKHFNINEWKKCSREGDVSTVMDKSLKCTVHRISGSIPAGNYIQFPKASSQSLGLTGHYLYLIFKPVATKNFVVHLDVATDDGLIVRISFSNIFKEFKSTSTWLQFPFISTPPPGSVEDATAAALPLESKVGTSPVSSRWTLLCLDLHYILSVYLNRKYSYLKTVRLCASMFVKNIFTSDTTYQPGVSMKVARKTGLLSDGFVPLPREMSFPANDLKDWLRRYDFVKFPSENKTIALRDVIPGRAKSPKQQPHVRLGALSPRSIGGASYDKKPDRQYSSKNYSRDPIKSRVALVDKLISSQHKSSKSSKSQDLPEVGLDEAVNVSVEEDAVHVYAYPDKDVVIHQGKTKNEKVKRKAEVISKDLPMKSIEVEPKGDLNSLQPDPILSLSKIVGFGGSNAKTVLWTANSSHLVYPCHAVIVSLNVKNGKQSFLLGHNRKISALAFNGNTTLLASVQTGEDGIVRIWKLSSRKCLAVFQTHLNNSYCLSFSQSGSKLCAVGSDDHDKQVLAVWDASFITNGNKVTLIAKAHTDISIAAVMVAPFDDSKIISCGYGNIRVWKVKRGSLRSHQIDLGEHHYTDFTDIGFEHVQRLVQDPTDRRLYISTSSGSIFEVSFKSLSLHAIHQLLPVGTKKSSHSQKISDTGIQCLSFNDGICATGSEDGFIRLWPLDFDGPFMEAEHEGCVTAIRVSTDGRMVSAGTNTGNLGILDIAAKSYKTLIRSHVGKILSFSFDNIRSHMATVSEDKSIKIWERSSFAQMYDFRSPGECPCIVAFHPIKELLCCGFDNGSIRVFNVASTTLLVEHRDHRGKIIGLLFTPDGHHLHSCDDRGSLALYDASTDDFGLVRMLPNALAKCDEYSTRVIAVDDTGRRLAGIGPSEFLITVFDARSLDELLRIDITSMANSTSRTVVDAATLLCYAQSSIGHLVAVTANSRLLKLEASTGQLLTEVSNIHRGRVTGVCMSQTGKYLATAGDKVIKIWDYHMRLDLNFQVFIGHSDPIRDIRFSEDGSQLFSIGECIFVWEFLGQENKQAVTRKPRKSPRRMIDLTNETVDQIESNALPEEQRKPPGVKNEVYLTHPREKPPQPSEYEPLNLSFSPIPQKKPEKEMDDHLDISSDESEVLEGEEVTDEEHVALATPNSKTRQQPVITDVSPIPVATMETVISHHAPPSVLMHFKMREKISRLTEKRYTAPPNRAGLKLKSVVGYDGLGRNNMVWHQETGLFAYTNGCIVVIEDLTTGQQRHLRYHTEDISTLAVHHDGQVIASASAPGPTSNKSTICIWEVSTNLCRKHFDHHKHAVIAMEYSRDDRFLVTIGDYRECSVVVWSTRDYEILATSFTRYPIHAVKWDPFTMNEFTTIGQNGSILFWLLDETKKQVALNVHEAEIPEEIFSENQDTTFDLTALGFAGESVLYVGTNSGVISAWDTRKNSCFMHWKAESNEITVIIAKGSKLITGGCSKNLSMWSVAGIVDLKEPKENRIGSTGTNGLVMEDEMQLDGSIISASFDNSLELGVAGTSSGTLWYINWDERSSIRLVSGHVQQVNSLVFGGTDDYYMGSSASDGSMRLWNTDTYEQTLQFLVLGQSCNCVAFRPIPQPSPVHTLSQDGRHETTIHHPTAKLTRPSQCAAGYSDGTVRMFDLGQVEMVLKMQPHPVNVTAIAFAPDGRVVISGGKDGLIAVSSPTTGMTVRMLNDHKGAPITDIHVSSHKDHSYSLSSPVLWLAVSADRRVSIWTADWSKDFCELVDWLTFPAPNFAPDGSILKKKDKDYYSYLPPSLARFSPTDPDIVVYTGYGMKKQISYYSISQKKIIRAVSLTDWAICIDISPKGNLIAIGTQDRLVKLVDYKEGTFQDFIGHADSTRTVRFSPTGKYLFSVGFTDILVWEVNV